MNPPNAIAVTCTNGHLLRAPERAVGKTLPCPVCRVAVVVKQLEASFPSNGDVANIVEAAAMQNPDPSPVKRDELSDTGVMRILGDADTNPGMFKRVEPAKFTSCPKCKSRVCETATVCKNCQCYLGSSPDYLRAIAAQSR